MSNSCNDGLLNRYSHPIKCTDNFVINQGGVFCSYFNAKIIFITSRKFSIVTWISFPYRKIIKRFIICFFDHVAFFIILEVLQLKFCVVEKGLRLYFQCRRSISSDGSFQLQRKNNIVLFSFWDFQIIAKSNSTACKIYLIDFCFLTLSNKKLIFSFFVIHCHYWIIFYFKYIVRI